MPARDIVRGEGSIEPLPRGFEFGLGDVEAIRRSVAPERDWKRRVDVPDLYYALM
jgi:hypothetical protein